MYKSPGYSAGRKSGDRHSSSLRININGGTETPMTTVLTEIQQNWKNQDLHPNTWKYLKVIFF